MAHSGTWAEMLEPVAGKKVDDAHAGVDGPRRSLDERLEAARGARDAAGDEVGAAALEFGDASFDTVVSCTMLHHVPTTAQQNRVLAEAFRVLRPGGVFLGSDSLPSDGLHQFHEGDTYNPVEPAAFLTRLQTVGFGAITLHVSYNLVFTARKPAED